MSLPWLSCFVNTKSSTVTWFCLFIGFSMPLGIDIGWHARRAVVHAAARAV